MKRILVVEDDQNILDIVAFNLEKEGYSVVTASNGEEGLFAFSKYAFDLVILDIMMPQLDGLSLLDALRLQSDIPILIMSAKAAEEDRLEGFSHQADDYICKPFSVKELMLRVKVHLGRYQGGEKSDVLQWGALTLDRRSNSVERGGEQIACSKKEFRLLLLFAENAGRCFSREEIMQALWGYRQSNSEDRSVDVAIRRLREKIEPDPAKPRYILSKRGIGYMAGEGE